MRRLFLRAYLGVSLLVLVISAVHVVSLRRELLEVGDRYLAGALEPAVRMARRRTQHPPPRPPPGRFGGPDELVGDLQQHLGLDARVAPIAAEEWGEALRARLRSGELVVLRDHGTRRLLATLDDRSVLVLGPFDAPDLRRRLAGQILRLAAALAVVGAALVVLLRPIERRLTRLALVAERIGAGELTARVDDAETDAVAAVGRAFDEMATKVEGVVAGQRELLRAVSHELRTPIARLVFIADALAEADAEGERARLLSKLEGALGDMRELVDELLELGRADAVEAPTENVSLVEELDRAAELCRAQRPNVEVRVVVEAGTARDMTTQRRALRRVVENLATNAARHASALVELRLERSQDGGTVVSVEDDGPGIPVADRLRVFEPFVQLDASRSSAGGAGLGLAIASRAAAALGGTLEASDSALGGARFHLSIPTLGTVARTR
ncbi:MAG: HAMP domain-containing protein [Myxococcales bacterium]|nr:HAMP domain-containing protein [Myxococcales bacterium]MCB9530904.1 HAMP domain-containing protein [Myxococcales bacterium]